ncbi:type II toxin-antitoxin system VapC family toxin [Saxibacter everestensis]|uniref:Type II toxin-antitoxin system VapC family toxin n=1 Tax=Saxibacter everestensis TaxID=2909229 RepID=A0ABY8QSZ0_9MICO|nr:type II toxin-antitoxin system VapC family toxin [Brevibacteriaceae bacterium ZFBP1038]
MRVYVDSSALLKRVFLEPESDALNLQLRNYSQEGAALITSSLAWVEVSRAIRTARAGTAKMADSADLVETALSGMLEKPITAEVVSLARRLNPPVLRSLDALHLASAILVDADALIAYDQRLIAASMANDLRAVVPTEAGAR